MDKNLIQIFVPSERKTKIVIINKKSSIKHLCQRVKEELHVPTGCRIVMIYDGSLLDQQSNETLESYGLQCHRSLDWFIPLNSGPVDVHETEDAEQLVETGSQISLNSLDLDADLQFLSRGECCVCFDDTPGVQRVRMSCGCIIGVGDDCIKRHCDDLVKRGQFLFTCPGCESNWQHSLVREVLSKTMTTEELKMFTAKVASNFAIDCPTIQKCPKCENFITHDPNKANGFINKFWVRCPICTRNERKRVEFCWVCLNPWKGNELSCGNDICGGKDPRNQTLLTCGTKSIDNIHNVPIYRACVKCGAMIEHANKCKHMTCKFCKCQFCFVCLKSKMEKTGRWQCGTYDSVCEVAPRQTLSFLE